MGKKKPMGKRLPRGPIKRSAIECRRGMLSKYITNKVYAEVMISLEGDEGDFEKISNLYKQGICELPTDNLELILQTHEEDLFKRQEDTLDVIISELARRILVEKK